MGHGIYVLAAACFEPSVLSEAREVLLALRGKHRKLHWYDMEAAEQQRVIKSLVDLDGLHVVVIGSPVPLRRQERARAKCLTQLATELHGLGVDTLLLEGRDPDLDGRDARTVAAARQSVLPKGATLRVGHCLGPAEPLLWAADVLAGACRASLVGRGGEHREALAERIYDVHVDTDC